MALEIRKPHPDELPAIQRLVHEVYTRDVAPHYGDEGNAEFAKYNTVDAFRERSENNHLLLGAWNEEELVGVAEMRNGDHVSLLFVHPTMQRKGIGKQLFAQCLDILTAEGQAPARITVNSSPNAVQGYERLGFTSDGHEKTVNGIRFQPMVWENTRLQRS